MSPVSRGPIGAEQHVDEAWPRKATRGEETISMYEPQLEPWEGDTLRAYAVLVLASKTDKMAKYGWSSSQHERR
jgi:hypothetical protein